MKANAVSRLLKCLALGTTCLSGTVRAQDNASLTHAVVNTLVDSIIGGAAGLSVDKMGVIFAGTFDARLYRIRMDGRAEVLLDGLYGATGNVIGPLGNLYQLSFFGGYISRIDRRGKQQVLASEFDTPMDVTIAEGNLYVANCGSNAISRVTFDGEVSTLVRGPPLNCPNGLTYASDDNLYVVNFSDPKLLKVTLQGEVTEFLTLPHRHNIIESERGHLYIASGSGRQLHRISLMTQEITHIAGSGERGTTDGTALEAMFNWPNGIAASEGGYIFINDLLPSAPAKGILVPGRAGAIRLVSLPSLTDQLSDMYVSQGSEAMVEAYRAYRSDPATAGLLDEAEVNGWGYDTLPVLPDAAVKIFQLNAESYPNSWRVYEALGDAYVKTGQPAEAIVEYGRSLELNPDNRSVADKIRRLREGG